MYVQATVFEKRHCKLPKDWEIMWQGIGQDKGNTIVKGDDWYIVKSLAGNTTLSGTISSTVLDGTVLAPTFHYPDVWWTNNHWSAYTTGDPDQNAWTVVHTPMTNWFPREQLFPYLADEDQGTTDPSDISSIVHGDQWFRNGSPRGCFKRLYPDSVVNGNYSPPFALKHSGKGSAPAGEYTDGGVAKLTVGYWNEDEEVYELQEQTDVVPMCNLGLVRIAPPEEIPLPAELITGWNFTGANWGDPDPLDWRYWWCIRCAILERESVLYNDSSYRMGTLIPNEQLLNVSPWNPPTLESIRAFRDAIIALTPHFIDFEKVLRALRDDGFPFRDDTKIDLSSYTYLEGGWTLDSPVKTNSSSDVSGFLKDAYDILKKLVVYIPSKYEIETQNSPNGHGWANDEDGDTFGDAVNDAISSFQQSETTIDKPAYYSDWQYGHPYQDYYWSVDSAYYGIFSAEKDAFDTHAWTAAYSINRSEIINICFPNASVLDGSPMNQPTVLWARISTKSSDLEVGDAYRGGIVTENSYHSGFASEGISFGTMMLPCDFSEMPATTSEPEIPQGPGMEDVPGWKFVGNITTTWLYIYWGESFKYGGPMPVIDEIPEEED